MVQLVSPGMDQAGPRRSSSHHAVVAGLGKRDSVPVQSNLIISLVHANASGRSAKLGRQGMSGAPFVPKLPARGRSSSTSRKCPHRVRGVGRNPVLVYLSWERSLDAPRRPPLMVGWHPVPGSLMSRPRAVRIWSTLHDDGWRSRWALPLNVNSKTRCPDASVPQRECMWESEVQEIVA